MALLFCVFGGYAVHNTMFDVGVMLVFGVLGCLMMRIDMAAAPFLMGFILGPLLEDNPRRSYLIADDFMIFFRSPICWLFILITALSLLVGIHREISMIQARHARRPAPVQ